VHARPAIGVLTALLTWCVLPVASVPAAPDTDVVAVDRRDVVFTLKTFVDRSRPAVATAATPAADERVLETTIAYPAAADAPAPLVVLAHGYNANPGKFLELIGAWAEAGYVVAAPQFPLTNDVTNRDGPADDVFNQPADVSYVIDRMLALDERRGPLRGRIDAKHIGLAGLSLGGWTTYGVVFDTCCRDERIDAAIAMSALRGEFPGGTYELESVPVMLMHAAADPLYSTSAATYPLLAAPKWFVTLHGGTVLRHAAPFEDSPDPADDLVRRATTSFWDRYLRGRVRAERTLLEAAQPADGSATLQHEE
jgi:predicted dienelactone hydrolase